MALPTAKQLREKHCAEGPSVEDAIGEVVRAMQAHMLQSCLGFGGAHVTAESMRVWSRIHSDLETYLAQLTMCLVCLEPRDLRVAS